MEEDELIPPVLSKLAKHALVGKMKRFLKEFERDYKKDLAVHLYSTHMLHLKTPDFPHRSYTDWPLFPEEVPDPKNTRMYVQEPDEDYDPHIETPIAASSRQPVVPREKENPVKTEIPDDEMIPDDCDDEDETSGTQGGEDHSPGAQDSVYDLIDPQLLQILGGEPKEYTSMPTLKRQKKIVSDEFVPDEILEEERREALERGETPPFLKTEEDEEEEEEPQVVPLTDPAESMEIEIERLFKRKVHERVHKSKTHVKRFEPVLDGLAVPQEVLDNVMDKFTLVMNRFGKSRRKRAVTYNWRDIVTEAGESNSFDRKMKDVFDAGANDYLEKMSSVNEEEDSDDDSSTGDSSTGESSTDDEEEEEEKEDTTNDRNETTSHNPTPLHSIVDNTGKVLVQPTTHSEKQQAEYIQQMRIQSSRILFERELYDKKQAEVKEFRRKKREFEHTWRDDYDPFNLVG